MGSDNYSGEGRGQDSPSESRGGPGAGAGSSSSGGSKGSSPSSGGNNGGLGGPTSNNSGNSSKSSPSKGSSSSGGGLNSAGNRASGAGPGASSNRSTTGGGFGGNSMGGGSGGMGGGLNSAGNRASGAGPGASANRSTTGGGFGSQNSPGMGGMVSDAARRADLAQSARASENASMSTYNAARSLSQQNAQRADLAQQTRTAEEQSMNSMADWGKEVKSVVAAGPGWTSVELNNGQIETRKGDRASRNNNPGNIEAGDFAKKAGAVGTDGRFAVFSTKEDGFKAISSLLGTSRYSNKTVEGAISSYAPPSENNTASYVGRVASAIGVSKDTPMSSLTTAQRDAMARAITGVEGNTGYTKTTTGTDRFSNTYMGGKATSTTPSTAERNAATTQEAAKAQQNDPSGLPPGTYRGYDPSGLPAETPAAGPVPTSRPERPRSLTEKVAAGAIDVGLGMLPGIGTAVSVVNGGLALTGNKTLGERIAGSIATGEGAGTGPDSGKDRLGGGRGGEQIVKDKSTVPEKTESFEDRYIKFVDPTKRPTPAEKWNYDTGGYA